MDIICKLCAKAFSNQFNYDFHCQTNEHLKIESKKLVEENERLKKIIHKAIDGWKDTDRYVGYRLERLERNFAESEKK